jgi:hypothetical protein
MTARASASRELGTTVGAPQVPPNEPTVLLVASFGPLNGVRSSLGLCDANVLSVQCGTRTRLGDTAARTMQDGAATRHAQAIVPCGDPTLAVELARS